MPSGIVVVGQIPAGLPTPGVPRVALNELVALMIPAAGIAIVAFSDNVLTARAFAARNGEEIDANAELRALGICNVDRRPDPQGSRSAPAAVVPRSGKRSAAAPSCTR